MECQALNALGKIEHIILKMADKGGGVVIQDRVIYLNESHHLLSDHNTYSKLRTDPLPEFIKEPKTSLQHYQMKYCPNPKPPSFRDFYNAPYFYHLRMVHKILENPLGCPIVASMESITTSYYTPYKLITFCNP